MKLLKRLLLLFFFPILILSCSIKNREESFKNSLVKIDSHISYGQNSKAIRKLNRLKKSASTYKNYASLTKRFLDLNATADAIAMLQEGIEKHPEFPEIPALLISVLIDNNRILEAAPYCERLQDTKYAGIAAEASILIDKETNTFNSSFSLLNSAYKLTDGQVFVKNAALRLASKGLLKKAIDLRSSISNNGEIDEPYFWACLAFDIGRFDPIFDDLLISLNLADRSSGSEEFAEMARKHLMLAADASFGRGDAERARAFWISAKDRSPDKNPVVFYNLALTALDEKERASSLIECIESFPSYYPVIAQYVREYMSVRKVADTDDISKYLEERNFYSMEMERRYFSEPQMLYTPEELFSEIFKMSNFDLRFIIENFRYEQFVDNSPNSIARGKAKIWNILEKYRKDSFIREYAKWYFSQARDFNACFSVELTDEKEKNDFYKGIEASIAGDFDLALDFFASSAVEKENTFAATANMGSIYNIKGETEKAIKTLSFAMTLADDDARKSVLQYEIASIYYEKNLIDSAIKALEYALDLNKNNYQAEILLKRLKQVK